MLRLRGRGNPRGPGRGNGRPRFFNRGNRRPTTKKYIAGPADNTIPELAEHYFDCNSFNEADRFINTKEKIIQYCLWRRCEDYFGANENLLHPSPKRSSERGTTHR